MAEPSSDDVLTHRAPAVSLARAQAIALDHYGIEAAARPVAGERDSNFHLAASDGQDYLLKLVNPAEDPALSEFQSEALAHMAGRDASLPIPRMVETRRGERFFSLAEGSEQPRIVRLLTWLPGAPLASVERGPLLPRHLGMGLARLDLALAGFSHPAGGHPLLWDIGHAGRLRPLLGHVEDTELRAVVERCLDRLEAVVFPRLATLRRQVIHNDFNPSNILVAGAPDGPQDRLAGIIDFGDMVEGPLIQEVAVAASYHVAADGDVLAPVKLFAAGYHGVLALEAAEIEVLFDLVLARMAQSVAIPSWRSTLEPENRDYILRNAGRAAMGLMRAQALSPAEAADEFHLSLSRERAP